MKKYIFRLHASSDSLLLDELSQIIGSQADPDSWQKGDISSALHKPRKRTVWKSESFECDEAHLEDEVLYFLNTIPATVDLGDVYVYIDICIIHTSAMCSFSLKPKMIRNLAQKGIGVEVAVYPACEADEEVSQG